MTLAFHRLPALLVFVAGSLLASQGADARDLYRDDGGEAAVSSRQTPLFAVVALKEQRVTIYGARGKFLEAPVSTGISGRETPAGIFSIVQKEEYHRSNLYDDASMPFMERITWSGIALHAGVLPGYPASHGCVRMPENFAEKLYGLTEVGMRVMIVREDIAAAEVPQPQMFSAAAAPAGPDAMSRLRAAARAAASDRDIAKMQERDARAAVSKKNDELKAALRAEKNAQAAVSKAQGSLTAAERALEKAKPEKAAELEAAKVQAQAKLDAAQSLLRSAEAATAAKKEAALQAEAELRPAAAAYAKAADRADAAERDIHPVSVFISRKTQRLYIRKNHMPVFEAPVMIRDAGQPLGSFVFTAAGEAEKPGILRWMLVSMYKDAATAAAGPVVQPVSNKVRGRAAPSAPAPADTAGAQSALARIEITEEARARISAAVLPGSSLIISDEGPNLETGKDTDFVVVMSGEPQGGLAVRHVPKKERSDGYYSGNGWFGDIFQ